MDRSQGMPGEDEKAYKIKVKKKKKLNGRFHLRDFNKNENVIIQ
jgi:hypothetical protein